MRTEAEWEYKRAKAKLKLERLRAEERWAAEHPHSGKVIAAALLVLSATLLFVGVTLLMQNNPWRHSPAPLQPVPSTTSTTPTCKWFPHRDGCYKPDGPCVQGEPCVIQTPTTTPTTAPTTAVAPCGSDRAHPLLNEACGDCMYWQDRRGHGIDACFDTPTTTKPDEFPPDVMCKAFQYRPPGCATVTPTVPNIPGSRQGQVI
jgi:hypothetical protein